MPQVIFLPHKELCPDGAVLEGDTRETSVLDLALKKWYWYLSMHVKESGACTTCHIIV